MMVVNLVLLFWVSFQRWRDLCFSNPNPKIYCKIQYKSENQIT